MSKHIKHLNKHAFTTLIAEMAVKAVLRAINNPALLSESKSRGKMTITKTIIKEAVLKEVANNDYLRENTAYWNQPDMDNEADENGAITVTLGDFAEGGKEIAQSEWRLTPIEDAEDYWVVSAICTASEMRDYQAGDNIEFELPKDLNITDLQDELRRALEIEKQNI